MSAISNIAVLDVRKETDSLGEVNVPSKSYGAHKHSDHSSTSASDRT